MQAADKTSQQCKEENEILRQQVRTAFKLSMNMCVCAVHVLCAWCMRNVCAYISFES